MSFLIPNAGDRLEPLNLKARYATRQPKKLFLKFSEKLSEKFF